MENEVGQTASALRMPRAAIKARSRASPRRRRRWAGRRQAPREGRRSFFGNSGFAHTLENGVKLDQKRPIVAHRRPGSAGSGNAEGRVEREAGFDSGMRLVQAAQLRQGGAQNEICIGEISVGLDRAPKPRDCLLPVAEEVLRYARNIHPAVGQRIAWAEAQGRSDAVLRLFGVADKKLADSNEGMGLGEISIELQRMFTFGDALRGPPRQNVDMSQIQVCARVVRN